jgi:hypothetical protein
MKPFETTGVWWLPQNPLRRVGGTLRFVDHEGVTLSLMDVLSQVTPQSFRMQPLIHGFALDLDNGKPVSLRGCRQHATRMMSAGLMTESFRVERAFLGGYLASDIDFSFRGIALKLHGLLEWAEGFTGMNSSLSPDATGMFHFAYQQREPLVAELDNAHLVFSVGASMSEGTRSYEAREDATISISSDVALSEEDWNRRYVYPLQNFVTFVLGRPSAIQDLRFRREDPNDVFGPDFQLFASRIFGVTDAEKHGGGCMPLFTVGQVKDRFQDVMRRWIHIHQKFQDACNSLFAVLYIDRPYLETRFLAAAHALELYDRARAGAQERISAENNRREAILSSISSQDRNWLVPRILPLGIPPFSEILTRLYDEHAPAMAPICSNDRDGFITSAIDARNYIVHHSRSEHSKVELGEEVLWLYEKLTILMKLCLLAELGFQEVERLKFIQNAIYYRVLQHRSAEKSSIK